MTPAAPAFLDFGEARKAARSFLPRALFDYIDRGTEGERALSALRDGFDARRIVPRVLQPVSDPNVATRYLGQTRGTPFVVAPTALAGLVRHNGEVLLARAASAAAAPFTVSTQSSAAIERIVEGAPDAELWFQLYVWRDRSETWKLLERVARCGVQTLLLTVDTPASPKKVHNLRNGFGVPLKPSLRLAMDLLRHPAWTLGVMGRYLADGGLPAYGHYPSRTARSVADTISDPRFALDMVLDEDFVRDLRRRWPGQLLLKGVLSATDAGRAFALGCDGVVVSSHGGRNHDAAATPLDVLPRIREKVGPAATLLADSGVQRGSDAAKLLSAGADAVLLGRAPLYGLAAGGEAGATLILDQLRDELRAFLAFSGAPNLDALRAGEWTG